MTFLAHMPAATATRLHTVGPRGASAPAPSVALCFLLAVCVLLAGACSPRVTSARAKAESSKTRVNYAAVAEQVEQMLPRIRRHAEAIAALGPRQSGQAGCDRTYQYIRDFLAKEAPGVQVQEFSSPVTVALDRTQPDQLQQTGEFSRIGIRLPGRPDRDIPAYAMSPNSAQACATHPPEKCPSRPGAAPPASASSPAASQPATATDWPCPHCEQFRPLVSLKEGRWEDFAGRRLDGAVVLLDFNSGDAWLRAAELGAVGAVFIEPEQTTVFQADRKYLATLPLHFPRLYVSAEHGRELRESVGRPVSAGTTGPDRPTSPVEVCLRSRLTFRNVPARGLEFTIPGQDHQRCFVLAGHFDARCIAPDLSYGAQELWGLAELLEVTRLLAQRAGQPGQPSAEGDSDNPALPCDVHVMFVSGHWQSQRAMRDRLTPDGPHYRRSGRYFKLAMAFDLVPEGRSVNLLTESAWDCQMGVPYSWLGKQLFAKEGWRDQIFEAFDLSPPPVPKEQADKVNYELADKVELFGGVRPIWAEVQDEQLAGRNDRSPLVFAPRYHTAEEPWLALNLGSFAFQTGRLTRLCHNTPLDRLGPPGDPDRIGEEASVERNLRPQLQVALSVLQHILEYPGQLISTGRPSARDPRDWGGYARMTVRAQQWDQSIGWFSQRLPGQDRGVQTFVQAIPTDAIITDLWATRLRNYLPRPLVPHRGQHRELQSFMFQDLRLLDSPTVELNTVYAAWPETHYDVVGYGIDPGGNIRYATDYGVHGDGNKAFQCTDVPVDSGDLYVPMSLFECGTLELFGLIDPQRYNPGAEVYGTYFQTYLTDRGDRGYPPYLRIDGVKDIDTHTDLERWGYTQYGPTAMVFLPAEFRAGAEVLLGSFFTNFGVLNNPGADGRPAGYRLRAGQAVRLSSARAPTPRACLEQLTNLDRQRLEEFARYDVASPLAKRYHDDSAAAARAGDRAGDAGDWRTALAQWLRAWIFESSAYRNTVSLLLDVVSTTVLYFVLLIPFSFLVERLVMPQRTVVRTAIVATAVFAVFAAVLYLFHPGFKLAHNVVVTTTAFVIVVMTVPALVLLLVRGVAMLRAIGSKAVITQHSEAESAGVLMAALSLAVSNMRRRRLRTALTLVTITVLVLALVLLTTSSAFDFRILEPSGTREASLEGVQVFNTSDRRQPMLTEIVELYEAVLRDEALVIRRECVNYGYDHKSENGSLYLTANGRRVRAPYFQVMDERDNVFRFGGKTYHLSYTLNWSDRLRPSDYASPDRKDEPTTPRQVHLSDLLDGEFLQADDVDACLLPNTMAEALGVKVGDTVTLMHLPLRVKGIWAASVPKEQADGQIAWIPGPLDRLTDLDGLPITAMRGSMFRQGEPDNPQHAPSTETVILPRNWMARYGIFPTNVYSMIVIPKTALPEAGSTAGQAEQSADPSRGILPMAERLAKEILNVDVFVRYYDPAKGYQSSRISMRTATHVKGSSMMLVVLVVAVLMILAIMTGTVYERMREIHIFSSVGLSPRHVAGMFLIEALVYAGIASVLGYFLGIVSLKALLAHLKATGQHQEFYPNYLGVFVLYSIGTAVLATVLSSLYPIHLASKIVNPSDARTWQLQASADEDRWDIRLPFIATTWDEARAMMVYAYDYLAIHQGERSGRFVCQTPPAGGARRQDLELAMPVWLAPFERNLTQQARLRACPSADSAWWELSLELTRVSGPPYLWRRGANVFVNMLCKHLLRWRAATPQQEAHCLARAEQVFPTV